MTTTRRTFVATTAAAAAAAALGPRVLEATPRRLAAPDTDPFAEDLANEALGAARDAGASYTDVRIGRYRRQFVAARERQVQTVSDTESYGVGVRVLVQGS